MTGEALPSGIITFLMTDLEGSSRLWEEHPSLMGDVVQRHVELLENAVFERGGVLVKSKGEGDSTFSVFARPTDAVSAAVDAQRAMANEHWPQEIRLRTRAALHTGEAELRDGDYYGTAVNRCARIRGIGHGGQILLSSVTADVVTDDLPAGASLRDLGVHRLRDLVRPERITQLDVDGLEASFPPLTSLERFRHNLPTQRTSFIGRDDEIATVRRHLEAARLVTLTGVGGCGKTRLALQVAAEELDSFEDGVFFVELGPLADPEAIPAAIAHAIGRAGRGAMAAPTAISRADVIDAIAARDLLIVLDNCEHLIEACAEIADGILDAAPRVRILATSREPLELDGEQAHTVPSLDVGEAGSADAIQLFVDRAVAARESFALSDDVRTTVAEICRRLDGIPLAIELAAAQVAHLAPAQIARRLDDRFALLTGGRRRAHRQQTLEAALDWSYELLSEDEKTLLRRLAVFPASFSLEAAEAVAGSELSRRTVELLRALVHKSLVATDAGEDVRYRLLETVRLYAGEKLVAAGEGELTRDRHRDFYVSLETLFDHPIWPTMDVLRVEEPSILAAAAWAERQGRFDLVGRLAVTNSQAFIDHDIEEGIRMLDLAIAHPEGLEPIQLARVLTTRSWLGIGRAGTDPAGIASYAHRALEIDGFDGPWAAQALGSVMLNRSFVALIVGDDARDEVESYGRRSIEAARGSSMEAAVYMYLGLARVNTGDLEGAADALERGAWGASPISVIETNLSFVHHLLGRHDDAVATAERAIARVSEFEASDWALYRHLAYALALATRDEYDEAIGCVRERVHEHAFTTPGIAVSTIVVLGCIHTMAGDHERASVLFGASQRQMANNIVRSPTDVALQRAYVPRVREALGARGRELRQRGLEMSPEEAIAFGLAED